jgi:iron(III) transport system ATP-binding protein
MSPPTAGQAGTASVARGRASAVIPALLTFAGVARSFGGLRVLSDVSFEVREGEVLCLLGPSGCGKSTLLRIAAGIEDLDAGRVLLDQREVQGPDRFVPPEERGVGLVFQDYALFPHLTIVDNVAFGLKHLARAEGRRVAMAALGRVALTQHALSFPHMLSGGEQQRVALARALVPRPRVLLMDEPFSNLDRRMRDGVRDETVALLREAGATVIIVTHDPEEAMRVADRIALMRDGRIVQVGTAEDVYLRPADIGIARFFSDLNEIEVGVAGGTAATPWGALPAPRLPDGPALLCIRPRSLGIGRAGETAGVPGRLLSLRFIGEVHMAELGVEGLEVPLRARLAAHPGVRPGADVAVTLETNDVLVFAGREP